MFELSKVQESAGFDLLETGWYGMHLEKLSWKTSAAGAEYINAQYKLDNGRVVFAMYHVFNANEKARNIALGSIKKALIASGFSEDKLDFKSKEDLAEAMAMINCEGYLTVRKDAEYGDKNELKNYRKREGDSNAPVIDSSNIPF